MNKKFIIGLIAIIVLIGGYIGFKATYATQSFSAANVEPHQFADEVLWNTNGLTGMQKMQMQPGQNYVAWTNNSGATTTVFNGTAQIINGSASSTFNVFVFSTSTATLVASQQSATPKTTGLPVGAGSWATSSTFLIQPVKWATSTSATTTSSVMSLGSGTVQVPPGWSVIGMIQNVDIGCLAFQDATNTFSNVHCEAATSTARNFDPVFEFQTQR